MWLGVREPASGEERRIVVLGFGITEGGGRVVMTSSSVGLENAGVSIVDDSASRRFSAGGKAKTGEATVPAKQPDLLLLEGSAFWDEVSEMDEASLVSTERGRATVKGDELAAIDVAFAWKGQSVAEEWDAGG